MRDRHRRAAAWAGVAALALVAVAVRTLAERGPTFLEGDLALLHVDSLRAAGLHQLLGPYDRFGWHHPGPAYAYLMSIADRMVGFSRPLQAEALAALFVDGVSLAAAAAVARTRLGVGAAAGVVSLGWVMAIGLGNDVVFNPWPPTVVVLPAVLLVVLAVAALAAAWRPAASVGTGLVVATLLAATFCLQTDVGTLPLVLPCAAVVLAAGLWGRLAHRPGPGPVRGEAAPVAGPPVMVPAAAGLLTLAWAPVLVQQWSHHPGNLSRLFDFFRAGHGHAGMAAGVRAAGWSQLAVTGERPPGAPPVGAAGTWAAAAAVVLASVLLVVALVRRRPVATAGASAWLAGTGLAALAGAQIVGPAYSYLTYWAAAPLAGAAVAVGDLGAGRRAGRAGALSSRRERVVLAVALVLGLAVSADLLSRRPVTSYSPAVVARAWSELRPLVPRGAAVGVAYPNRPDTWNVGTGLVDRLESGGHAIAVSARWSNQVVATASGPPALWISVVPAGTPPPPGLRPVGTVGTVGAVRLLLGSEPATGSG